MQIVQTKILIKLLIINEANKFPIVTFLLNKNSIIKRMMPDKSGFDRSIIIFFIDE